MSKHNIVIVGGGFGGLKTALTLANNPLFQVTLISDHPDFRIYGTLYRVSTGGTGDLASIPLDEIFDGKNIKTVIDTVTSLDKTQRTVTTASGASFKYDGLVLSLGVTTNYFHIEGLAEYSFGIKSLQDARKLKHHIHQQITDQNRPDLAYVVVGGGPTGVELAGELPHYIRKVMKAHGVPRRAVHVDLVEAAPRLLPRSPKDISNKVAKHLRSVGVKLYLKTAVQAQTADALMVNNKPIRSHTVIWTAGVMNNPFFANNGFQLARNGKVRTDQFLQAESGIYVIGDNADTPYSGMAQTALHDGAYVAKNLIRLAHDQEPIPYHAKKPIYVFPAGPGWAALLWGRVRLYGWPASVLRSLANLVAYRDYEPWALALKRWAQESVEEEDCPTCAPVQYRTLE